MVDLGLDAAAWLRGDVRDLAGVTAGSYSLLPLSPAVLLLLLLALPHAPTQGIAAGVIR